MNSKDTSVGIDVLTADAAFFAALMTGDVARLEQVLSDDFLIVDVQAGNVSARRDFIDFVASKQVVFDEITTVPDEAIVRLLTEDVTIVIGRTAMRFTTPDGSGFTGCSRYTHVFLRDRTGRWQLVSAQGTGLGDA